MRFINLVVLHQAIRKMEYFKKGKIKNIAFDNVCPILGLTRALL